MPFGRMISVNFADRRLLPLVLSLADFAQRGYVWGYDGNVHYCFLNPDKVRFEIFKKQFWWRWLFLLLIPGAPLVALFTILIAPKHYSRTAENQAAAVFSNGPQMAYPFGLTSLGVIILLGLAFALPPVVLAIVGGFVGTVSIPVIGTVSVPIPFGIVGMLLGINLAALLLWLIGEFSIPYGTVLAPSFSEFAPAVGGTYYFGRGGTAFGSYVIGPGQPNTALSPIGAPSTWLTWVCGGLTPIVVNGKSASSLAAPWGGNYVDLMNRRTTLVVWGLATWDPADQVIHEAIASQIQHYGSTPPVGVIIVAGCRSWSHRETASMIAQRTVQAAATDGATSSILGSSGQFVITTDMFKDAIQRYGMMCVPD